MRHRLLPLSQDGGHLSGGFISSSANRQHTRNATHAGSFRRSCSSAVALLLRSWTLQGICESISESLTWIGRSTGTYVSRLGVSVTCSSSSLIPWTKPSSRGHGIASQSGLMIWATSSGPASALPLPWPMAIALICMLRLRNSTMDPMPSWRSCAER